MPTAAVTVDVLGSATIDQILNDIDGSTENQLDLFGVFDAPVSHELSECASVIPDGEPGDASIFLTPPSTTPCSGQTELELTIESALLPLRGEVRPDEPNLDSVDYVASPEKAGPRRTEWAAVVLQPSEHYDSPQEVNVSPIPSPASKSPLSSDRRLLLCHYKERAVLVFSVIDNPKSPWRIFHLPRALQIVGELDTTGTTSPVRFALLYSILSVSAFHLANDRASLGHNVKWQNLATELRCEAIGHLNQAVDRGLFQQPKAKYKEILAAVLTMITIDVRSGLVPLDISSVKMLTSGTGCLR
jgi:hypothetical protein